MNVASVKIESQKPLWGDGLLSPLSWAAYVTWIAVAFDALDDVGLREGSALEWCGAIALALFVILFGWRATIGRSRASKWLAPVLVIAQAMTALFASWCLRDGIIGILLIIVAAQLVAMLPLRASIALLAVFNLMLGWIWSQELGATQAFFAMLSLIGFQAFAALTGLYAVRASESHEALMLAHGELLATRELLSESTRSEERLRLSRELHDVAGHKLTALKLNLARLSRDQDIGAREEVRISTQLATELLDDIRAVVGELRRHDGVDLSAALNALAQSIPGVRIDIEVDADSRLAVMGHAETLLRCAQEALTNALRHGAPTRIVVRCRRTESAVEVTVADNGTQGAKIRFGNGLNGMRERLEAVGGALRVGAAPAGGVELIASVPA